VSIWGVTTVPQAVQKVIVHVKKTGDIAQMRAAAKLDIVQTESRDPKD
jgi:histidinol dehydrogenase